MSPTPHHSLSGLWLSSLSQTGAPEWQGRWQPYLPMAGLQYRPVFLFPVKRSPHSLPVPRRCVKSFSPEPGVWVNSSSITNPVTELGDLCVMGLGSASPELSLRGIKQAIEMALSVKSSCTQLRKCTRRWEDSGLIWISFGRKSILPSKTVDYQPSSLGRRVILPSFDAQFQMLGGGSGHWITCQY